MDTASRNVPFTQIPDWVITAEISHATFRVYAAICHRVDKSRTAFPGIRRIADDINASTKTVQRAIETLELVGAIVVTRSDIGSNHYFLPLVPAKADSEASHSRPHPVVLSTTPPVVVSTTELDPVLTTPNNKTAASQRDPIWDAISEILGDPSDSQRSLQGKLVAELKRNEIDGDELRRIAQRFAGEYGPGKLTLGALTKNWARWRDSVALAHMTDDQMSEWHDEQKRTARRRRMRSIE